MTLTLDQALSAVETTSITVLLSREAVQQALASADNARSGLLPNITLDGTQRRSRTVSYARSTGFTSTVPNRFDGLVNARIDALDAQRIATYSASKAAVRVAELDLTAVRQTVMNTVAATYFGYLRNVRRIDVLEANVARAVSLLDLARRQAEAGVATQIDITRAEAAVATAEQARLQQETVLRASELQLKQLLAIDLSRPVQLGDFVVRRAEASPFVAGIEETAFERRADLLRAKEQLRQNELEVKAAKFDRLPSVALVGTYGYASEVIFDGDDHKEWSGSAVISVPIFEGNRIRSQTNLALSRQRAQELRIRDLRLKIGAEVRLASQDARSRFAQVGVAERSLRLAEDEMKLAQARFEQGVADNREIIEAQNRLAVASDGRVEAVYQYNLSRLELARAQGDVQAILAERQ